MASNVAIDAVFQIFNAQSQKTNPLRVLHIGKYFPPFFGGIENFMCSLMQAQRQQGTDARGLLHHHERFRKTREEQVEGVFITRVRIWGILAFVPVAPSFLLHLLRILMRFKPEVLHLHMPNVSCFWCLLIPSLRKVPWVIHWHSDVLGVAPTNSVRLLYPIYRLLERALLSRAARIITTSPPYLHTSKPLQPFTAKCEVVPLGVPDIQGKAPSVEARNSDDFQVLCVGRLTYYKGHQYLLEAVEELIRQRMKVRLVLVGDGELKEKLKSLLNELGLENSVTLRSNLDEEALMKLLGSTDLVCLPSIERTEAFGMVLLEAMRLAKPCLVTNAMGSGMGWVVQDGVSGLVVEARSSKRLAEKIAWAAKNKNQLREMGVAGRKRFEESFTIEQVANHVEDIYHQVFASHQNDKRR